MGVNGSKPKEPPESKHKTKSKGRLTYYYSKSDWFSQMQLRSSYTQMAINMKETSKRTHYVAWEPTSIVIMTSTRENGM